MKLNSFLGLFVAATLILTNTVSAQLVQENSSPILFSTNTAALVAQNSFSIDIPDTLALLQEDVANDLDKNKPYRIASTHKLKIDLTQQATATIQGEKTILQWNLVAENAKHLAYYFSEFHLPPSAVLYIIDNTSGDFYGGFGANNNISTHTFFSYPFKGSNHTLQIEINTNEISALKLQLSEIYRGYRSLEKGMAGEGDSGPCNININCPVGDDFQDEKRAVVHILNGSSGLCTGTLINNTANQGKQYILTGEHCLPDNNNTNNWAFRFGYESATCSNSSGIPVKTVSGAQILAHNAPTDFAIVEITQPIPASYEPYFAGWSIDVPVNDDVYVIHHPKSDMKKISQANFAQDRDCFGEDGTHCFEVVWNQGTTEKGSSGSVLLNNSGQVIGNLVGGDASCSNPNDPDFFGMLKYSFEISPDDENVNAARWLDRGYTGITSMPPYDPAAPKPDLDLAISAMRGIDGTTCGTAVTPSISVYNAGIQNAPSAILLVEINGTSYYNQTISINSEEEVTIDLPQIELGDGDFELVASITPTSGTDIDNSNNTGRKSFITRSDAKYFTVEITLDQYGSENRWYFTDSDGNVIHQGGPYNDNESGKAIVQSVCLPDGCYDFNFVDNFGDGICCEYGNGSYVVRNEIGDIVASGWTAEKGEEGVPITETSKVCNVGIHELMSSSVSIFPNPANHRVSIQSQTPQKQIAIYNVLGAQIQSIQTERTTKTTLSTKHLAEGIYMISVTDINGKTGTQRLVINH